MPRLFLALFLMARAIPAHADPLTCWEWVLDLADRGPLASLGHALVPVVGDTDPRKPLGLLFLNRGWVSQGNEWHRNGETVIQLPLPQNRLPPMVLEPKLAQTTALEHPFQLVSMACAYCRGAPYDEVNRIYEISSTLTGDLTAAETSRIQAVVDEWGKPLAVFGSAARGERRNRGTDLPLGDAPNQRSDIDYWLTAHMGSDFRARLPDHDGKFRDDTSGLPLPCIVFSPHIAPLEIRLRKGVENRD
ncbi:hypothetical protein K2X33_06740 [bacterium]|nr:hypothetical protein [bacterium]